MATYVSILLKKKKGYEYSKNGIQITYGHKTQNR